MRGRKGIAGLVALVAAFTLIASGCVLNGDWEVLAAPVNPTPGTSFGLEDVACPTPDFCMAIGSKPGAFADVASVQTWDGATWTELPFDPIPSPDPNFSGIEIADVACASPTSCVVAWFEFNDDEDIGSVSGWNGTGWTHLVRDFWSSITNEVACVPGGVCVAGTESRDTAVWNGSSFTTFPAYVPELNDLACPSSTYCVGLNIDWMVHWNGSDWASDQALPSGHTWTSLACPSTQLCFAVGASTAGDPVAARYDGATWTITPVPLTGGRLDSVSCSNAAACVAVGKSIVGPPTTHNVAIGWNGAQWYRLDDPPEPPGAEIEAISCAVGDRCVAVGSSTSGPLRVPFAASYSWTPPT